MEILVLVLLVALLVYGLQRNHDPMLGDLAGSSDVPGPGQVRMVLH